MQPQDIVNFWMSEHARPYWWAQSDAFDTLLRVRFGGMYEAACRGELDHWAETAEGSLGLVLLLDQLSRNLNRGSAHTYDNDAKALEITRAAVAAGHREQLELDGQKFLSMPYMHAEDAAAQAEGMAFWETLGEPFTLWHARLHQIVVERFGRFPHRDPILGRPGTTAEEWDAIASIGMTFGVPRPASATPAG